MAKMKRVCFENPYKGEKFIHVDEVTNEMHVGFISGNFGYVKNHGLISLSNEGKYQFSYPFQDTYHSGAFTSKKELLYSMHAESPFTTLFYVTNSLKAFKKWLVTKRETKKEESEKLEFTLEDFSNGDAMITYSHIKDWAEILNK